MTDGARRTRTSLILAVGLMLASGLFGLSAHVVFAAQTFYVTTTRDVPCGDPAGVSLLCAFQGVNGTTTGAVIDFSLLKITDPGYQAGTKNWFLAPASLPPISAANVTIDGYTAPHAVRRHLLCLGPCVVSPAVLTVQIDGVHNKGGSGISFSPGLFVGDDHERIEGLSITDFTGDGIFMRSTSNSVIDGNWIGIAPDGNAAGNGTGIGVLSTSGDTIGGSSIADQNVISNSSAAGIDATSTDVRVEGNDIGVDPAGSAKMGNQTGISSTGDPNNPSLGITIGGTGPGSGNVISGNSGTGISLVGGIRTVQGNWIGTNPYNADLGNGGPGVTSNSGSSAPLIVGGTAPGAANTIANNAEGVRVGQNFQPGSALPGSPTLIQHNVMLHNPPAGPAVGIDLVDQGSVCVGGSRVPNRPNEYTPCPAISVASPTSIRGTACFACTSVEVFIAAGQSDDEGQTYLGTAVANHGSWTLNAPYATTLSSGQFVTATATEPMSSLPSVLETSQFGPEFAITAPTAARTARLTVSRSASWLTFHWHLASRAGEVGLGLYRGAHRLNTGWIPVRINGTYRCLQLDRYAGRFTLRALLRDGQWVSIASA